MATQFFKGGELELIEKLDRERRRLRSEYSSLLLRQQIQGRQEEIFSRLRGIRERIVFLETTIHGDFDIVESSSVAAPPLGISTLAPQTQANLNAQAAVIIVEKDRIEPDEATGRFRLIPANAGDFHELCEDEKYAKAITARSVGSGILVGPSSILTAAHCVAGLVPLENLYFVFDFVGTIGSERVEFEPTDVYEGETILDKNMALPIDWAVVKLKSKVQRRSPVRVFEGDPTPVGTDVYVIGHPLGMTRKSAGGAHVRSGTAATFVANLDVFGGNSGSAVYDAATNDLLGVVTDGSVDLLLCGCADGCKRPQKCADNGCNGEVVVRTTEIALAIDFAALP
jgi:hypothetical protein